MKKGVRPLVIANWKMNPPSVAVARRLFTDTAKGLSKLDGVDVAVAPPTIFLSEVSSLRKGNTKIKLCAQDAYWEKTGAHTGETSIPMLKNLNVTHVIAGHSEKRAKGMTDDAVNKIAKAALKEGLTVVVCVGERKRDAHGDYLSFVERQILAALSGIPRTKLERVVIAYEPIWAIGTGDNATPADVHEMKLFIQRVLTELYGRNWASTMQILYGGSVNAKNVTKLMQEGKPDGFLVGGASLKPQEFITIVNSTEKYGN
jgi:triosephosphate isomerase